MFHRITFYLKVFLLNPKIFLKRAYARILIRLTSFPKGAASVKIGDHTIDGLLCYRTMGYKLMYLGYCGVEIANNINKYLSEGGVFIDVGAGIGYFSVIASNIIGPSGQVYSFEPLPVNADHIKRMINSNKNSNIKLNSFALGDKDGVYNIYKASYSGHTVLSMKEGILEKVDEIIKVKTKRLDTYLQQNNINKVSLIKIDVEGYEFNVLRGLSGFFERSKNKPSIICEIFAPAYSNTDITINELYEYMKGYGYQAYNIFNPRIKVDIRKLDLRNPWHYTDVIFKPVNQVIL